MPFTLDPGETVTCTFSLIVSGDAGDLVNDLITVTGKDDDGHDVSDSDDATVTITDVPSEITVTKTANPTVVQDSGPSRSRSSSGTTRRSTPCISRH